VRRWIRQEQVDVLFVLRDQHWHAISLDLKELYLEAPPTLEGYTPPDLASMLGGLSPFDSNSTAAGSVTASDYFIPYDDKTRSPAAAFCTRNGVKGLFKFSSVMDPQPGVKVRYRLWDKSKA